MSTQARPVAIVTGAAGGIGRALLQAFEEGNLEVESGNQIDLTPDRHVAEDLSILVQVSSVATSALLSRSQKSRWPRRLSSCVRIAA